MVGKRLADITEVPREDHQVHVMVADDSLRVRRPPNMMLVDGMPLDPEKTYGVVSNNYVRNGGDGYAPFTSAQNAYDYGPDLADVTAEFIAANGAYTPYTDGRITVK